MFERFTERARAVIVLAQDEARLMKHQYIGTEHILLGLLRSENTVASEVLLDTGRLSAADVRQQIERIVGNGEERLVGQLPFTPRANKAIDLSMREALSLGHNYIGTEHILLALVRDTESVASRILLDHAGLTAEDVRDGVIAKLVGPGRGKTQKPVEISTAKKEEYRNEFAWFKRGYDAGWAARDGLAKEA